MTEAEIYDQLTDIFRDVLVNDDIVLTPETTAKDVEGWDSYNHLTIIVALEARFGLKMTTTEIEKLTNVADLVATIRSKLGTDRPPAARCNRSL